MGRLARICSALVLLGGISLAASGAVAQTVLKRGTANEPSTLDPHKATGNSAATMIYDFFLGPMALNGDAELVFGGAKSYAVSGDGLTYTFNLRQDVRWSDGTPVTAEDYVYSHRRLMKPETAARFASFLYAIKNARAINKGELPAEELGVEATGTYRLRYTLETPTPYFPELLATNPAVAVPRHVIDVHGQDWISPKNVVTSGPYTLSEYVPQQYIKAVKNPEYFAADELAIDEVYYYPSRDLSTSLKRYRAGELDAILNFPPNQLDMLREKYADQLHIVPNLAVYYFLINGKKPPFDDPRVRRALSMAVDRDIIANQLLKTGVVPAQTLVPDYTKNYDAIEPPFADMSMEERQTQAKALLAEAGFGDGKPLEVELKFYTQEETRRIAVAVGGMWRNIGVNVNLVDTEFRVLNKDARTGQYETATYTWFAPYNDAQSFLQLIETGNPNNLAGYSNPEFDDLMAQSDRTLDPAKRKELMRQAEELAMNEFPIMPVYFYSGRRLVSPKIQGWTNNARGVNPTKYLSFAQ